MGVRVCAALDAADGLELVAAVDPQHGGERLGTVVAGLSPSAAALGIASGIEVLATSRAEVAVDFTVADAARSNLAWCAEHAIHAVCGTTGLGPDDLATLAEAFGPDRPANALVAANFSMGAVLMMRCAELCAPFFEGIEIIELHHGHKKDAPSGTSLVTAERIEEGRRRRGAGPLAADPTERQVLAGTRGGMLASGVHIHSVRLPGLVAHQEVILGAAGETLSIRHDSNDPVSFMPGVLLAVRRIAALGGLTVGLEPLLGIGES